MSPEAQRIAIAEACGWKNCRVIPEKRMSINPLTVRIKAIVGIQPGDDEFDGARGLPDYLSDLNAMHEAEKARIWPDSDLCDVYFAWLDVDPSTAVWFATAAQRAEAFLRTLNLWDDSK